MDPVTARLRDHYSRKFREHGSTERGVDWNRPEDVRLRYHNMLAALEGYSAAAAPALLDVGCGYGGLLDYANEKKVPLDYTGIDVCADMVAAGRARHPGARFETADAFDFGKPLSFDIVVCNGILTQKLETPLPEMDRFANRLIRRLFELCRHCAAFNVMTTRVNFTVPNLYYRDPADVLAFCIAEVTPRVRLDHSYPLYEYTVYLRRVADTPGRA
jgi:SAM-dependent methyltransferase